MVRERILHHTREEIPYVTGVVIESFKEEQGARADPRAILVERDNQKGILIGKRRLDAEDRSAARRASRSRTSSARRCSSACS